MWSALAGAVDLVHALLMAAWILGLPLLFWHRWPAATRAYAGFAIAFVVINLGSRALLGECVLSTLARACLNRAAAAGPIATPSQEWFTVRFATAVFRLTPSHELIKRCSEGIIVVTAAGVLATSRKLRATRISTSRAAPSRSPSRAS
jgi:hypothetical protein